MYLEHVRYVEQLRRFHGVFPREQVLILIYDDFRADNERTIRAVLRFLEVDDTVPVHATDANPTVRVRSPRVYELEQSLYLGRGRIAGPAKAAIKLLTPRRARLDALALLRRAQRGKPLPPDQRLTLELHRRFKGEVLALSEYLDRDLVTLWGYDDVD